MSVITPLTLVTVTWAESCQRSLDEVYAQSPTFVTVVFVPPPPEDAELEALLLGFGVEPEVAFVVEPEVFFFLVDFLAAAVAFELLALAELELLAELLALADGLVLAELLVESLGAAELVSVLAGVVVVGPAIRLEPEAEFAPIA